MKAVSDPSPLCGICKAPLERFTNTGLLRGKYVFISLGVSPFITTIVQEHREGWVCNPCMVPLGAALAGVLKAFP